MQIKVLGTGGAPRHAKHSGVLVDGRVLFVHFGTWFYAGAFSARLELEKLGRATGLKVIAGYEGQEIDVVGL